MKIFHKGINADLIEFVVPTGSVQDNNKLVLTIVRRWKNIKEGELCLSMHPGFKILQNT
jgi:hypothetical protein